MTDFWTQLYHAALVAALLTGFLVPALVYTASQFRKGQSEALQNAQSERDEYKRMYHAEQAKSDHLQDQLKGVVDFSQVTAAFRETFGTMVLTITDSFDRSSAMMQAQIDKSNQKHAERFEAQALVLGNMADQLAGQSRVMADISNVIERRFPNLGLQGKAAAIQKRDE